MLDCYLSGSIKAVKTRVEQAEDISGALQQEEEAAFMHLLRQDATEPGSSRTFLPYHASLDVGGQAGTCEDDGLLELTDK